jgi:hypothetical protein
MLKYGTVFFVALKLKIAIHGTEYNAVLLYGRWHVIGSTEISKCAFHAGHTKIICPRLYGT